MNGFEQGARLQMRVVDDVALQMRQSLDAKLANLVLDVTMMNSKVKVAELMMF